MNNRAIKLLTRPTPLFFVILYMVYVMRNLEYVDVDLIKEIEKKFESSPIIGKLCTKVKLYNDSFALVIPVVICYFLQQSDKKIFLFLGLLTVLTKFSFIQNLYIGIFLISYFIFNKDQERLILIACAIIIYLVFNYVDYEKFYTELKPPKVTTAKPNQQKPV